MAARAGSQARCVLSPFIPRPLPLKSWVPIGVYSDRGTHDFSGSGLGMKGHEKEDAAWMAAAGVDYLKVDDMSGQPRTTAGARADYERIRDALNATGRPIFFSTCGHSGDAKAPDNVAWMGPACAEIGNACRIAADVREWGGGTFGTNKAVNIIASYNGTAGAAGAWPDPDLLFSYAAVGGDGAKTCQGAGKLEYCTGSFCDPVVSHSRAQFGLWAVMGAPLLLSFSLTNLDQHQIALYANPEIVAVNQDADAQGRGTAGGRRVSGGDFPSTESAITTPTRLFIHGTATTECSATSFPHNRSGVESLGLQANHAGDASAAACMAACCRWQQLGHNCSTWQYNPAYHPRGYPAEPCWGGTERAIRRHQSGGGHGGWAGASAHAVAPPPPPPPPAAGGGSSTWNVWARNLHDGGTAMIFINSAPHPANVSCDARCAAAAGLRTGGSYRVRDLYARTDVPAGVTVGPSGFGAGVVAGDAGSVLWKLTPS
jgi:hypothetical protein